MYEASYLLCKRRRVFAQCRVDVLDAGRDDGRQRKVLRDAARLS
jgi:hypothetical protein